MKEKDTTNAKINHAIPASELVLKPDGAIYHLNLHPEELADTVLLVGDPERVSTISKYFDQIELIKTNREFVIHTGYLAKKRLTVLSTGMGSENIDIVLNELDALVNIDLSTHLRKPNKKSLTIIHLGTCGTWNSTIALDSIVISAMGFGLSNLMAFYQYNYNQAEQTALQQFKTQYPEVFEHIGCFVAAGSDRLIEHFADMGQIGHTLTCAGFYGPQGRVLNGQLAYPDLLDSFAQLVINNIPMLNIEMETAAIYGLGRLFGHHCCSVSTVVAQRANQAFTKNVNAGVEHMITGALEKILCID